MELNGALEYNIRKYMVEMLVFIIAGLTLLVAVLIAFIFHQGKKNKTFDKNNPEFIGLQKEVTLKDDYIAELKKDKQLLVDNSKNADDFKEISEKSFKEYNSLVSEYKNFHEKLPNRY